MKKFTIMLTCLLLAVLTILPAGAAAPDQPFGADALGAAWEWYENVPDYSSGYWLGEDGVLTVGLVDQSGREAVLAIVGDAPVHFVTHAYSYNELKAIQKELESYLRKDVGLVAVGVYVMDNRVQAGMDTSHPAADAFIEKMTAIYGDRVYFEGADGLQIVYTVEDPIRDPILTSTVDTTGQTTGVTADGASSAGTSGEASGEGAEQKNNTPATIAGAVILVAAAGLLTRTRRKTESAGKETKE